MTKYAHNRLFKALMLIDDLISDMPKEMEYENELIEEIREIIAKEYFDKEIE